MEGHGRVMTKGNEASEEGFLRRRVFVVKGNTREQSVKERKATTQRTDRRLRRT